MYSSILVPLDGSKTAETVLPYARALARRLNLPAALLSAVDIAEVATHLSADSARHMDTIIESELKNRMTYLSGIAKPFGETSSTYAVEKGRADEVIIEKAAADKDTLIAMATHGRSGLKRWLLGSVAEKVLRATTNPLLLVRANDAAESPGDGSLRSVVVPLDGSGLAESALPTAIEMAEKLGLEVVLLRAFELPASTYYATEDYLPNYEELKARIKEEAESYLEGKVAALKARGLENVSATVMEGSAAEEIIEYARGQADTLVAMCTHGRSGVRRWVLGSVTEKVIRHCGNPVLVIFAKTEPKMAERTVFAKPGDAASGAMRHTID